MTVKIKVILTPEPCTVCIDKKNQTAKTEKILETNFEYLHFRSRNSNPKLNQYRVIFTAEGSKFLF